MSKPIVVLFISNSSLSVKWLLLFHFGTSRCRWEGEESIPLAYELSGIEEGSAGSRLPRPCPGDFLPELPHYLPEPGWRHQHLGCYPRQPRPRQPAGEAVGSGLMWQPNLASKAGFPLSAERELRQVKCMGRLRRHMCFTHPAPTLRSVFPRLMPTASSAMAL